MGNRVDPEVQIDEQEVTPLETDKARFYAAVDRYDELTHTIKLNKVQQSELARVLRVMLKRNPALAKSVDIPDFLSEKEKKNSDA